MGFFRRILVLLYLEYKNHFSQKQRIDGTLIIKLICKQKNLDMKLI